MNDWPFGDLKRSHYASVVRGGIAGAMKPTNSRE
jgi:heme O synthase-like polyprenyltransferase